MKQQGSIEVQLDKLRHLRFDMNAIAEVERVTGWDLPELSKRLQKAPSIIIIRACLWAGLLHEEPGLTLRAAGELLSAANLKIAWPKVLEALNLAFAGDETASPFPDSGKPN